MEKDSEARSCQPTFLHAAIVIGLKSRFDLIYNIPYLQQFLKCKELPDLNGY